MVQQRTLRSQHEDAHYCARNYKNLRYYGEFLKRLLMQAGSNSADTFISSDDKAKVCIPNRCMSKYVYYDLGTNRLPDC